MSSSCYICCYSRESKHTRDKRYYSPHLHEEYAHDIALRASVASSMTAIDDQVELSHVNDISHVYYYVKLNIMLLYILFKSTPSFMIY